PAPAVDPEPPRAADPSSGVRPPGGPVAVPRPADGSFPLRAAIYTSTPAHRLTRTSRGQAGAPAVPPAGGQAQRKARPIRARCLRRWLCSGPDRRIVRLAARGGRTPAVAAGVGQAPRGLGRRRLYLPPRRSPPFAGHPSVRQPEPALLQRLRRR